MHRLLYLLFGVILGILIVGFITIRGQHPSPTPLETISATKPLSQPVKRISPAIEPKDHKTTPSPTLLLYFIALNDNGSTGEQIGCGDGLVAVSIETPRSDRPLYDVYSSLLNHKKQYYGQSGLYDALYQSSLVIRSATIKEGVATIELDGQLQLGGVCDNPRVEAQLTAPAKQFASVKQVNILLNGKPLSEALSLK